MHYPKYAFIILHEGRKVKESSKTFPDSFPHILLTTVFFCVRIKHRNMSVSVPFCTESYRHGLKAVRKVETGTIRVSSYDTHIS